MQRQNQKMKMKWFASLGAAVAIAAMASACMPQEVPLPLSSPSPSATPNYAGFTGLVSAQTTGATKVLLSWNATSDPTVVAYIVYNVTSVLTPTVITSVPVTQTQVTLTSLANESLYTFRVRAVNAAGVEDGNTSDISAIPYAGVSGATVQTSTSAQLTFADGSNADSIQVLCLTPASPTYTTYLSITNVTEHTTVLSGLTSGTQYTCRVALEINGFVDNNTSTVTFTPIGQATQAVFSTQPVSTTAGSILTPAPVVTILDANNNVITAGPDSNVLVTLALSSTSTGSITGTATATAVNGVATFSNVQIDTAGTKVLTATTADTSTQTNGSLPLTATSNSFTITAGAASPNYSSISVTPTSPLTAPLTADGVSSYIVTIALADAYNNPINGIKPQFVSSNTGDSLTQPSTTTGSGGVNGQTTGSIDTTISGTRALTISSPTGLTALSAQTVFVPGTAVKLAYNTQPANSPSGPGGLNSFQVAVEDAQGNVVNTSTAAITVSIFSNPTGGVLSGTATLNAVNGLATFGGLGISKSGTGYKLVASATSLEVAYSNSFNMTAGVPAKISVSGPASVLSGSCSTAYTFQLQDTAGNPANASANTPVSISGLGAGALYASSACAGSPVTGSVTFTSGSNSKTLYFKDNNAEGLTFTASDPSNVMSAGTLAVASTPALLSLAGPATAVAGKCSNAITVTTQGASGTAGPVSTATLVDFSGLTGTSALLYSDSACSHALSGGTLNLTVGSSATSVYLKDNKSETVSLSVVDPAGVMTTTSAPDVIAIGASNIAFTSTVTSVVAGVCSPAFTVQLKDAAGNVVTPTAATPLAINGLTGTQGSFYSSPSCSGATVGSSISIQANSSSAVIYFRDYAAETLSLFLSDPASVLANSATITLGVSPSALQITGPSPATVATNVCAGPFTINTLDGNNNVTAAITPITVNLTGAGNGGTYYSDSACTQAVTSFVFNTGTSAEKFYFVGLYPTPRATPNTFKASDQAGVLAAGTMNFAVTAAPAFIGSVALSPSGNFSFATGVVPVASRMDGPQGVFALHFDSTKQYLYVSDNYGQRIIKYDYLNKEYIGWIGGWNPQGGIGPSGSNVNSTLNAQCANMVTNEGWWQTPGWCVGGPSFGNNSGTTGNFSAPSQVTDDGTWLYVTGWGNYSVMRYNAVTGTFGGWIGRVYSTSAGASSGAPALQSGTGVSNSCASTAAGAVTPGWCIGGYSYNGNYSTPGNTGDGGLTNTQAIGYAAASTGNYIYVGNYGSIKRYNASTGAFMGWIGWVGGTAPALSAASDVSNTCSSTSAGHVTPGWCVGGTTSTVNAGTNLGGVNNPQSIYIDSVNDILYVGYGDNNGTITAYNLNSGALIQVYTNLGFSPYQMTTDGTYFYMAGTTRILRTLPPSGNFLTDGWIGKVNNANSMSGNPGCSTLVPNADTPGWCTGGTSKNGIDETAVNQQIAIELDANGNILTGEGWNFPAIKQWSSSTGDYQGTLTFSNVTSPANWSNSSTPAGLYGFTDKDFWQPDASYTDAVNGILYVVEGANARIKKISTATGAVLGWIGGITSSPTGGATGCAGAAFMAASPGWCLGAMPNPNYLWGNMINSTQDGIMQQPIGMTSDGTYLYVTDVSTHRVQRFSISTGLYGGWIGGIGTSPTGGATGCNGAAVGTFTPGWCTGGYPTSGTGNGFLYWPGGITYAAGNLYVVDQDNNRVSSYNASTGAFNGWIGAIGTAPTGGCTTAANGSGYNVSVSGWCLGGAARASVQGDKGGGFYFSNNGNGNALRNGITTDNTYLYIANSYNSRIDKWSLAGVYQGSTSARPDAYYASTWTTNTTSLAAFYSNSQNCSYPQALWTDGTYLYGTESNQCGMGGNLAVWKMNLMANNPAYPSVPAGGMVGWQGAVQNTPTGGATGCTSAAYGTATPGWCQGGLPNFGLQLGMFWSNSGVSGDANFIYVSDETTERVVRIPK
jgi:hypothetical protein